jgi:hypothetical protein
MTHDPPADMLVQSLGLVYMPGLATQYDPHRKTTMG